MESSEGHYLPMMMKVYQDGQLTSALKKAEFVGVDVRFSMPRGMGLELVNTKPGRIVVVAGGTGLFPFSDLIDLLYKDRMVRLNHRAKDELLTADPLLRQNPFEDFSFVFLIAINEPEDIHPITLAQLAKLSEN